MSWTNTVIWWHCYPLRFVGAERERIDHVEHRLGRITHWLDYVAELGADGVLLAPVFSSATHGYDTLDHYRIDPRLGDDDDVDALIGRARELGIRVSLDGVFNHVGRDHDIVQRALTAGPGAPERGWLQWDGDQPRAFEGHGQLVELDLTHPPVQDYVVAVMQHWLDRGVSGWRLDAAYRPGADAWRPIVERVKLTHPDCWILAEVIHGDYADFVARSGVDSVTQYELWKAVWSSLNDGNLHELSWTLTRHAEFATSFRPQTFIGNHDVTRIATRLTDERHLRLAYALLLLLPGIPSIYAGDEQAFTGEKTETPTGDDAVRPAFPDRPSELSDLGRWAFHDHQRLIELRRRHPWLGSAALSVGEVTDQTMSIELRGPDSRASLLLNASAKAAELPSVTGPTLVPPFDWLLVDV